jgi:mono/diheme cytochrome c family protein
MSRPQLRSSFARRVRGALVLALAAGIPAAVAFAAKPRTADGKSIFRFDTFGDEQLWTDRLRMHEVIEAAVSPRVALSVGLKVDAEPLPPDFLSTHDLDDPATTLELIRLNAVVGVVGKVADGHLKSVGITCALCHSTVDDSVTKGIGRRLDGWPNIDLNPGAIIALSPALTPAQKAVYNSWGPGKYDPRFNIDGINGPLVLPPAFGLRGVGFETFTGDGPVAYWNNYVAVTQMGGHGSFSDPRIGISITQTPDLVTPKLPALEAYQLSLKTPPPPPGSFDPVAAARGAVVFAGKANCASCHIPPTYTDVLSGPDPSVPFLHDPTEVGTDPAYASRTATGRYRTTPLRALWQHPPYFHDGSARDLAAVVNHYDGFFNLGLTMRQKADLVEFLKTL